MENLLYSINIVSPVFLIIFLGYFLKKRKAINENFVNTSSKVVFNVTLPALIFLKISSANLEAALDITQIAIIYFGTITFYLLSWLIGFLLTKNGKDRASFVQGSVRSNFVIVGFALIANMFGNEALGHAAILALFIMPLYNTLAVIVIVVSINQGKKVSIMKTIKEILMNPLIIAILVGLPFSFLKIKLPQFFITTTEYLADLTLPLALLGIGASLSFTSIKKEYNLSIIATVIKNVMIPAVLTYISYKAGLRGNELGVLFILFATPTAIASFIMAKAMGCNSELAGNIVVVTTISSVVTISLGIFIMKMVGVI